MTMQKASRDGRQALLAMADRPGMREVGQLILHDLIYLNSADLNN